jgi:rod shape-determining protein MreC
MVEITNDTNYTKRSQLEMLSSYKLIPAKVVTNSINQRDNLITLDKGSDDGVRVDMGVACGNGVVGVVYLAGEHYSVVLPALNNRSRISCTIRSNNYFGYLTWKGGDPSEAYVEDVPRHAKVKRGDWVETSGYSSIFPPGISVGRIEKIYDSDDGLSYRLLVKLSTPFSCLRDVCVIADQGLADRLRLQEAAHDSLMLMPKQE